MKLIKRISRRWIAPVLASSGLCLLAQAPSQALQFNFSYEKGTSYEQMLGFEVAAGVWSTLLTDNVTVNLHVGSSGTLPKNVVGGALPGMQVKRDYLHVYNKLVSDAVSGNDRKAIDSTLQKHKSSDGQYLYYKGRSDYTTRNIFKTSLTNANAKAIGLINPHSTALDGMIMMSDLKGTGYNWNYDFDRSGGISNKSIDFLSVAIHEIGHALGFVSSLDLVTKNEIELDAFGRKARVDKATTLDLFRRSNTTGSSTVELRAGAESYLSIDGGKTKIPFARGAKDIGNGSDGYQTSHWKYKGSGIMGHSINLGERRNVNWQDRVALDVIGWDLRWGASSYNLSLLENQAKSKLAKKLSTNVSWLNNNKHTAASRLSGTNTSLLANMTAQSDEYYQLFGANTMGSAGWWQLFNNLGYAGWWQEYVANEAYGQKAYFSTLSPLEETQDVPEPTSLLGIAGFILFGLLGRHHIKH